MSVRACGQCIGQSKTGARCKRRTCRTEYCFQHLQAVEGLKLAPSKIPDAGVGLFATKPFKKGEKVTRYTGKEYSEYVKGPYVLQIHGNRYVDSAATNNAAGRFVNDCRGRNREHCSGNNARFSGSASGVMNIKATKKIKPGAEVYVPYSRSYWQ